MDNVLTLEGQLTELLSVLDEILSVCIQAINYSDGSILLGGFSKNFEELGLGICGCYRVRILYFKHSVLDSLFWLGVKLGDGQ